jgi:hypothetical protein
MGEMALLGFLWIAHPQPVDLRVKVSQDLSTMTTQVIDLVRLGKLQAPAGSEDAIDQMPIAKQVHSLLRLTAIGPIVLARVRPELGGNLFRRDHSGLADKVQNIPVSRLQPILGYL